MAKHENVVHERNGGKPRWFIQYDNYAQGPWESEAECRNWWRVDFFASKRGKVVSK